MMKTPVIALALLLAGSAYAQSPPTAQPSAEQEARKAEYLQDLATLLDLNTAQKAQVQGILEAQHARMRAEFEQARASGTRPDREQMCAQFEQQEQETLQQLGAVLTPQQLAKFKILQKIHHGPHGH